MAKVIFKIFGATDWTKNNYYTAIAQFLSKSNHQNVLWKMFFFRSHVDNEAKGLVLDLFLFLKQLYDFS